MELESQVERFRERGLGVAALSYDSVEVLAEFAQRKHITCPLLSDPGSAVIRSFGLLNPEYPEGDKAHGVPYPGTFVVDAPGAKDYRPLGLELDPQAVLLFHPPVFPTPKPYHFVPLDETVPVYEGAFRVVEEVTLVAGPETQELLKAPAPSITISGRLDYQVCSDRVCYPPASLPVSWTLKLRPLDRDRSPEPLRH